MSEWPVLGRADYIIHYYIVRIKTNLNTVATWLYKNRLFHLAISSKIYYNWLNYSNHF